MSSDVFSDGFVIGSLPVCVELNGITNYRCRGMWKSSPRALQLFGLPDCLWIELCNRMCVSTVL
jgi:hypothetical protein